MCGRYHLDEEAFGAAAGQADMIEKGMPSFPACREIYPGDLAPVLCGKGERILLSGFRWGYRLGHTSKRLIINARAESVRQKRIFSNGILNGRIVAAADSFYEWDQTKEKHTFRHPDGECLFMAGIYDYYKDEPGFIILTTQANESVCPVHDRMPLILNREEIGAWLFDREKAFLLLSKKPAPLKSTLASGQLTLF